MSIAAGPPVMFAASSCRFKGKGRQKMGSFDLFLLHTTNVYMGCLLHTNMVMSIKVKLRRCVFETFRISNCQTS